MRASNPIPEVDERGFLGWWARGILGGEGVGERRLLPASIFANFYGLISVISRYIFLVFLSERIESLAPSSEKYQKRAVSL